MLIERLKELQTIIYERYNDMNIVPSYFKIRKSFPYKPSGKRDIEALSNETEGFIYVDKAHLLENQLVKIKRK